MTLISPLSLLVAASNAGLSFRPVAMSNFDTRTPVNMKYCDILNSARIRYSANHLLLKNPTLSNNQSLSNVMYPQTGTLVSQNEAFNRTPAGVGVATTPKINVSYAENDATASNVNIEMTANNSGFALWQLDNYVYGGNNEGVTVTVALKTPTTLPSHVIDLKGYLNTGAPTGDALVLRTNIMYLKSYFNGAAFGWSNTGFTIASDTRTVVSVRCPQNGIQTYQDGLLKQSYTIPFSFAYSPYAQLMGVDEVSGATAYAGTAFYEFMIHDFALTPGQIQILHDNIRTYYKWGMFVSSNISSNML